MSSAERHAAVESLAYDLWIARGRPEGSPEVDWRDAERLLETKGVRMPTQVVSSSLSKSEAFADGNFSQEIESETFARTSRADGHDTEIDRVSDDSADSAGDGDARARKVDRSNSTLRLQKTPRKR